MNKTQRLPQRDSKVRCNDCGREEHVNFGHSLTHGWPKCPCNGYTMTLVRTKADISAAVARAIRA